MEFMDRFAPLMSRALHCTASSQTTLSDIHADLCAIADTERSIPYHESAGLPDDPRRHEDVNLCRFAVYAWVDEMLLNAPRPDAAAWMGISLQSRYFDTSTAGREVFARLQLRLDALLALPNENSLPAMSLTTGANAVLEDELLEGMKLANDLEQAAALPLSAGDRTLLCVYAECILYGFCGRFFPYPEVLKRLRQASGALLRAMDTTPTGDSTPPLLHSPLHWLEPALYVVVPLCATIAFALYCAGILANLPLKDFFL